MDKLDQELKQKIEQLTADKQAKANYLFAESVRKFLTDKRSMDALDLVKKYHAGHAITITELIAATVAAAVADAVADAVAADAVADVYAADVYAADAVAYDAAATAVAYAAATAADSADAVAYVATAAATTATTAATTAAAVAAATANATAAAVAAAATTAANAARRADSSITIESQIAILDKLSEEEVCKLQDDVEDVFKTTGTTESATISGMKAVMTQKGNHINLTILQNLDNKITNLYFSDTGDNRLSNDVIKLIAVILCKLKGLGEGGQLSFLDEGIKVIDELQKKGE